MNYFKKVGISLAYLLGSLFILIFLITLLNYFNILNGKVFSVFKILAPVISLFIGGFILGKRSQKKGWLEGLKLSLIFLIILLLFNYLGLGNHFEIKNLIYYLILTVSGMFGSMIGINKHIEIKE